jgi:membrane protease YdiL (CAAX protease family)
MDPGDAPSRPMTPMDPPPSAPGAESTPLAPPPPARLGTSTFTIEGRSAPALFVVGWLASVLGVGLILVGLLGGGGPGATVLVLTGLMLLSIGLVAGAGSQGIERRVRGDLPYRGPSPLLVFAAALPISILGLILIAVPLGALGVPLDGPFAALLSVTVQAVVYVALVRLLVVDTGALSWREMGVGPLDGRAFAEMGGSALWAIPVIAVTVVVSSLLLLAFPVNPVSPLPPTGEAVGFALSLLAGVIVAPFGEEILFRAFATTAWVRGMGRRRGLVLGALVFAFAHVITTSGSSAGDAFGLAVVGFGSRVPIALALGWVFLRRGTMWASFGLHAAFNAVLLVVAEVASRSI